MTEHPCDQARELIRAQRYSEARAVLKNCDDPEAQNLLKRLNVAAPRSHGIVHHRAWAYLGTVLAILAFSVAAIVLVYVLTTDDLELIETLSIPDNAPTTTINTFDGEIELTISGTAVTPDTPLRYDAFYALDNGSAVHPIEGAILLNGQPLESYLTDQETPTYASTHIYVVTLEATGALTFSLGPGADPTANQGFTVEIRE